MSRILHLRARGQREHVRMAGDLEHTHLVKGLDFALLNKVRAELNKQKKVEEIQNPGST